MGKKKPEEMAKQRQIFLDGCAERGVDSAQAAHIFDLMEKFAGYGFNKSHSAAYAVLSYQTAWLKAHYPAEFMAAVMSSDMDSTDKLVGLKDDCRALGIRLLSPNVNASLCAFAADADGNIRYGLGAVKGVGRTAIDALLAARDDGGPFVDLADLCHRVDLEPFNRRMFEALIKSGAMDVLHPNRRSLFESLPDVLRQAEQDARAAEAGQNDLFGAADTPAAVPALALREVADWHARDRLRAEKEALGLYLSGHPFASHASVARQMTHGSLNDIASMRPPPGAESGGEFSQPKRQVTVAGLIFDVRKRGTRTTVTLDDNTARVDVQLFSDLIDSVRHLLVKDAIVVATGALRWDSYLNAWIVSARSLRDVEHVVEEQASCLTLAMARPGSDAEARAGVRALQALLEPYRGGPAQVRIDYRTDTTSALVTLGEHWRLRLTSALRAALDEHYGEDAYQITLGPASG